MRLSESAQFLKNVETLANTSFVPTRNGAIVLFLLPDEIYNDISFKPGLKKIAFMCAFFCSLFGYRPPHKDNLLLAKQAGYTEFTCQALKVAHRIITLADDANLATGIRVVDSENRAKPKFGVVLYGAKSRKI